MIRNYNILIPTFVLLFAICSCNLKAQSPDQDKELIQIINYVITKGHYEPMEFNDTISEKIFDGFIETLDPSKRFFLQADIDSFAKYKTTIDDQLKVTDLSFYYEVLEVFNTRVEESKPIFKEIIQKPFNYTIQETLDLDYEKAGFSNSKEALISLWRKQLKARTLNNLTDKLEAQEKDSTLTEKKSFATIEKEARKVTEDSMDDFYDRINELEHSDWFSVFVNDITSKFDPHTNYMAPSSKKRFDISMSGKLEGIGARLEKKGEYVKVNEIISGGPAWKAGDLKAGDIILKVAQGKEEPIDIVGMRLDDSIEYIKGPKGTEVRLTIKKIEGTVEVISIIRDVVELDETFAKSSVIQKYDKKFGIINLPKFYIDFDEKNYRNSATDMKQEISRLEDEGVEGLIIDLRNNGGGSLRTAIEIAGLFIEEGPIVQVKYRDKDAVIYNDEDPKIHWKGPLVILVNDFSASASEIFSAAMQDYGRAIVIGSKQTYGKGTVQNLLPLSQFGGSSEDIGALKMTIQKFYRVNGGSTQLKGVDSDVFLPNSYSFMDLGERDYENPLAWDAVPKAKYKKWDNYANFNKVISNSKDRIAHDSTFNMIYEKAKRIKEGKDDTIVQLDLEKFKAELKEYEIKNKAFEEIDDYKNDLVVASPMYEIPLVEKDTVLKDKRTAWHKNINKDMYVNEAVEILNELKLKNKRKAFKN